MTICLHWFWQCFGTEHAMSHIQDQMMTSFTDAYAECCARSRCQGQGQVITSYSICEMYKLVPALDGLWHSTPDLLRHHAAKMQLRGYLALILRNFDYNIMLSFRQLNVFIKLINTKWLLYLCNKGRRIMFPLGERKKWMKGMLPLLP